jgi:ornithine cyclodeaminase
MTAPHIDFASGEAALNWLDLTDALTKGHDYPRAELADTFLYRGRDTLLTRSAWIDGLGIAMKSATIFPDNAAQNRPSVNGTFALMSDAHGALEATIDFHLVTKWKTAADSLLAARHLARSDSRDILIIGAGQVARSLRQAYAAAFPDARFTIWNRNAAKAQALAADFPGTQVASDLADAVAHADIITCATGATEPVLRGDWLRPGQHVDLIGAFRPGMREADNQAITRARIFVDSRATTLGHIGEIDLPIEEGAMTPDDIQADFYELERFQRDAKDITLFKNGGGAHLDLMTARHILTAWSNRI